MVQSFLEDLPVVFSARKKEEKTRETETVYCTSHVLFVFSRLWLPSLYP
jgi:hypothetical protein